MFLNDRTHSTQIRVNEIKIFLGCHLFEIGVKPRIFENITLISFLPDRQAAHLQYFFCKQAQKFFGDKRL